jgi:hypothetical protein
MSLAFIQPGAEAASGAGADFTKTQLVEAILELNATASRDWLMSFDFADLRGYWRRLQHAGAPRGNGWSGSSAA